ncbi:MAG: metallophosphoesterase family protein [Chloroflexota bacterium]
MAAERTKTSLRILHFADAHIDIANYGRHDPQSGLPLRVVDFLNALDQIVDRAVTEEVDLVLFAGDAYKDRNPQPTFQREWGRRMMRLSRAGIPTVLLVGNHDNAPASGRAHTLQEYGTLQIPHLHVADKLDLLTPDVLGLPVQIVTIPWVARSHFMSRGETAGLTLDEILEQIEARVADGVTHYMEAADPDLPLILLAHASVHGARYGSERTVMLGQELVLSRAMVADKRWSYVALGHIHRHQSLNDDRQPPIVYPGSIERIDFGEANEEKGFVLANVSHGESNWEFVKLETRQFIDLNIETPDADTFMADVMNQLPPRAKVRDAICRVRLSYPRDWEPLLDEAAIHDHFSEALSIQIQKHRQISKRARLGDTAAVETMAPEELLATYWQTIGLEAEEAAEMQKLAREVLSEIGD